MPPTEEKVYSGKQVVIVSMIGFVVLTVVMGVGTYTCGKVLGPMLSKQNERSMQNYRQHNSQPPR